MSIRNAHQTDETSPPSIAAPFEVLPARTVSCDGVEEIMANGQPWDHDYKQASRGRFRITTTLTRTTQLELAHDRTATGVRITGAALEGVIGFALFLGDGVPRYADGALRRGEMLVLGERSEVHYLSRGPEAWMLVAVGAAKLGAWSVATDNGHLLDAAAGSRLHVRDATAERKLATRLAAALRASHEQPQPDAFENEVLWALASCSAPQSVGSGVGHAMLAEPARREIEAGIATGRPLLDVYDRLGAAPRTVQRAFQLRFGTSPQQYRAMLQLNRARSLLSRPRGRDPVRRAAFASGFTHLGRFAGAYRDYFGESPSQTVTRAMHGRDLDA